MPFESAGADDAAPSSDTATPVTASVAPVRRPTVRSLIDTSSLLLEMRLPEGYVCAQASVRRSPGRCESRGANINAG